MQDDTKKFLRELMNEIQWNPSMPDRRKSMSDDHDLLMRMDEKLNGINTIISSHTKTLEDHKQDDTKAFQVIADRLSKTDLKMAYYSGALAVLIVVAKWFFKF